jgi:hypothetical protein
LNPQSAFANLKLLLAVGLLLLLAFGLRYYYATHYPLPLGGDAAQYAAMGQRMAEGHGLATHTHTPSSFRPPVYPFFLSLFFRYFGKGCYGAIALAEVILSTLTLAMLAWWSYYRLGRERMAFLLAIGCFYPAFTFLYFGPGTIFSETLYTLIFLLFLLDALPLWHLPQRGRAARAGVWLGLASLVKASVYPMALIVPVILALKYRGKEWKAPLLLFICAVAVIAPWTVRNAVVHHAFVPVSTNGGLSLYWSNSVEKRGLQGWPSDFKSGELSGKTEVEKSRYMTRRAIADLKSKPERIPKLLARKVMMLLDPFYSDRNDWHKKRWNALYVFIIPFVLLAFLFRPPPAVPSCRIPLALVCLYFVTITLIFHGDIRYRAQFTLPLLFLAADGFHAARLRNFRFYEIAVTAWLAVNGICWLASEQILGAIKLLIEAVGLH